MGTIFHGCVHGYREKEVSDDRELCRCCQRAGRCRSAMEIEGNEARKRREVLAAVGQQNRFQTAYLQPGDGSFGGSVVRIRGRR